MSRDKVRLSIVLKEIGMNPKSQTQQKSRRLKIALVIALFVAANVALIVWRMNRLSVTVPTSMEREPEPDLTAGVPIQRGRIEDFIQRVKAESLEQSIDNLNFHERLVFRGGVGDMVALYWPHATERCLSNRRLARVFEDLSNLPEADRVKRTEAIFQKHYEDFKGSIEFIMSRWEAGNPPTRVAVAEQFGHGRRSLTSHFWAVCGSLLLVAHFCPAESSIDKYRLMVTLHEDCRSRVDSDPEHLQLPWTEIKNFTRPDLYYINLALWVADRHFDVAQVKRHIPDALNVTTVPLHAWNAHTNAFDFTHQKRGVPTDDERILTTLSVCFDWHDEGDTRFNYEPRQKIISQCWAELRRQISGRK